MKHIMKLQPEYFNMILNGTKRIELRLNDEKRQKININDTIEFLKETNLQEKILVRVTELIKCNSFEELLERYDIAIFANNKMTKEELLNVLETFYNKDKQNTYGVLGIKFELTKE